MARLTEYNHKFESFKNKTLFKFLDEGQQAFVRDLAFKYHLSFQEFRQMVEASRDLCMWEEDGLESMHLHKALHKKELMNDLHDHLRNLLYPARGGPL